MFKNDSNADFGQFIQDFGSFLNAYATAALWSSLDNDAIEGRVDRTGENLDDNFDVEDIHPDTFKKMSEDCLDFIKSNIRDLQLSGLDAERAGHDFWLNRNGHGSGFWDEYSSTTCERWKAAQEIAVVTRDFSNRDSLYKLCDCPYHACERLSKASRVYSSVDLYVGDDNKIYC